METDSNLTILVINGGSSSLKFSLYDAVTLQEKMNGQMNDIGAAQSHMEITQDSRIIFSERSAGYASLAQGADALVSWLKNSEHTKNLTAIGHRLVQGGPSHRAPMRISPALLKDLAGYLHLSPNHLPGEIALIKRFTQAFPDCLQVACFDTFFHRDMPAVASEYPFAEKYKEKGLIRYGFHGLSYEYIMHTLTQEDPEICQQKTVIAHLGNGASMAAVVNGRSADTTMGLSPAGGLVMGTRSGDLDPGVMLFLLEEGQLTTAGLDKLVNQESGLKAIAGTSNMQELLTRYPGDPKALKAIESFCYTARKFIGSLAAGMGGLQTLIFTGGIGENAPEIRERICTGLDFIGVRISKSANDASQQVISARNSPVKVSVIKTNEAWIIAKHTQEQLHLNHE